MDFPTPSLQTLQTAAELVYRYLPQTPQLRWPLLEERSGARVWVKHENHTPVGAFKVRGGLWWMSRVLEEDPECPGVVAATRGNHGQSIAFAAGQLGLSSTVVVPRGNNPEKNAAMRSLGAELLEIGDDFQDALEASAELARERGLRPVPSYHHLLVEGVASGSLELLQGVQDLEVVYVPIGLGSGICAMVAARDALGLDVEIVGVVAERAPCYALSFAAGEAVSTPSADTLADGVACRIPHPEALKIILGGVSRIVAVSEEEILAAMGYYLTDTHNLAEGAAATPLAALLRERDLQRERNIALVHSGGNADRASLVRALSQGYSGRV